MVPERPPLLPRAGSQAPAHTPDLDPSGGSWRHSCAQLLLTGEKNRYNISRLLGFTTDSADEDCVTSTRVEKASAKARVQEAALCLHAKSPLCCGRCSGPFGQSPITPCSLCSSCEQGWSVIGIERVLKPQKP